MKHPTVRSRARAGSTLIEVMTAVALLTVASSGILVMQGATTRANQQAYESTVALSFAQTWIDRFKRDSLRWVAIGVADRTNGPVYLNGALSDATSTTWLVPAYVANSDESYAADAYGFDVANPVASAARIRYCVNYRLELHARDENPALPGSPLDQNSVRADVRVWWHRMGSNRTVGTMATGCATVPAAGVLDLPGTREVYLSNVFRWEDII